MKRLTLFLGAGFSKWAAGLPVANQLFDFQVSPFGVREQSKLDLVAHHVIYFIPNLIF